MAPDAFGLTGDRVRGDDSKHYAISTGILCCDYIKNHSEPIEVLYFFRPINIILSADLRNYIKDIVTSPITLISHKS